MGMRTRALIVLGLWVAALVALAPLAGRFDGVKTDRATDYLPASAQSTAAAELESTLPGGTTNLFVLAYFRAAGLTAEDRATAAQHYSTLRAEYAPGTEQAQDQPAVARDNTALLYTLTVDESRGESSKYIKDLRAAVANHPAGLSVQVTGPAALQADFDSTFDGVDTQLLLVTVLVVAVILLLTYRSPLLWLVPLISVAMANVAAMAAVYGLATLFDLTVSEESAAVLTILVFGVGTDYAMLIVARYREELRRHAEPGAAMRAALRQAAPAIVASAATVTAGLLCLLVADMNSTAGLGPVGAAGIVCTLAVMLTVFPALLVLCGRWVFWPRIPRVRAAEVPQSVGLWDRVGTIIAGRPAVAAACASGVLAVLALGLLGNTGPLAQVDRFISTPESVAGQQRIVEHFPERGGLPLTVLARSEFRAEALRVVRADPGIGFAEEGRVGPEYTEISAIPKDLPDSPGEYATIERLRSALSTVGTVVGGPSAANLDTDRAATHDQRLVLPLVLLVVTVVLGLLLRSIVAPIGLVLTVLLSFGSALGASVFVFEHLFGFHGLDSTVIVMSFLFLVALGVDYNIFLMSRAREEALRHGTKPGMLRSLSVTGGVITSAGVVLAATFAVLMTLPLVALAQVGFVVAFGVLLDTLVVRSVLVPALTLLAGDRVWWPSKMALRRDDSTPSHPGGDLDPLPRVDTTVAP
ncbi:MMPL family transporter [Nocardia sp. NPDC049149]|uniref:MMPL family transporter n=1 Tax=Nocardia sp. NPDC049149 TaxID=3364315 RepID=UPI00371759BB